MGTSQEFDSVSDSHLYPGKIEGEVVHYKDSPFPNFYSGRSGVVRRTRDRENSLGGISLTTSNQNYLNERGSNSLTTPYIVYSLSEPKHFFIRCSLSLLFICTKRPYSGTFPSHWFPTTPIFFMLSLNGQHLKE